MAWRLYPTVVPTFQYFLDLIPCRTACPVHTNAGAYVRAVADGNTARGYDIARAPNPLASVCGRICAHPCESKCRRGTIDQPISIRALKRTLTERHGVENRIGAPRTTPLQPLGLAVREGGEARRIAVVGAGPAGVSCAHDLAMMGYRVTLFEAAPVAGGMLYQGVPEYRLPRDIIRSEIDQVLALGVEFRPNWRLGRDFTVADLMRNDYAAVFLGLGATRGRDLNIPGRELDGVINGVDFLLNVNLGYHVAVGERVVVIGGGNVAIDVARTVLRYAQPEERADVPRGASELLQAWGYDNAFIDAARTALRLGARHVQLVCLESRNEMPATPIEVNEAEEEGITLLAGRGPKAILGSGNRVSALETIDVASVFDAGGRFNPSFVAGSEKRVEADTIILAVGQQPDTACLSADSEIEITPRGLVAVDPRTLSTTLPGVFCGGDLAFGPRIVIEAVADGKRAALAIHEHLGGGAVPRAKARFVLTGLDRSGDHYDRIRRHEPPSLAVTRRTGFREVEEAYGESEARAEGSRCLQCNVQTVFDSERCILCSACVEICPEACLTLVPVSQLRGGVELDGVRQALDAGEDAGAIVKDEERCIRCGLCAVRCPTRAITMELLDLDESPVTALGLFHEGMGEARR
ncbi:MAG TPA: FAD-dependent oxidoreductase [Vicinamibacterales bacterium]|jgi:NADPH-dependent glutamate synthase beta subunit-like oxidoreductase/NAD-dependent dihydropyrimidine dehydrogenase PreA subunit